MAHTHYVIFVYCAAHNFKGTLSNYSAQWVRAALKAAAGGSTCTILHIKYSQVVLGLCKNCLLYLNVLDLNHTHFLSLSKASSLTSTLFICSLCKSWQWACMINGARQGKTNGLRWRWWCTHCMGMAWFQSVSWLWSLLESKYNEEWQFY